MVRGLKLSFLVLLLLATVTPASGSETWPVQVGDWFEFAKYDSAVPTKNEWTFRIDVVGKVTFGDHEYLKFRQSGYSPDEGGYDEFLLRATETGIYALEGENEYLEFQLGSVGTTWSTAGMEDGVMGWLVREIVSIGPVTVPAGTFDIAYVVRSHFDPEDPSLSNSPYWDEWIVPSLGFMVKEEDYWTDNPPTVAELTGYGSAAVPAPATMLLLGSGLAGLAAFRRRFKNS